jgi:hypothetical protein
VKALTLWQPWASLVALGVKSIETRSWSTSYRGPLAVHAAKRKPEQDLRLWMPLHSAMKRQLPCGKCGDADFFHVCHFTYTRCLVCGRCDGWTEPPLPLGAVVATCTLVDVVKMVGRFGETPISTKRRVLTIDGQHLILVTPGATPVWKTFDDQRPYGDFTPGRFAWLLADIEPLAEPVPAKGRQGLWEWTP